MAVSFKVHAKFGGTYFICNYIVPLFMIKLSVLLSSKYEINSHGRGCFCKVVFNLFRRLNKLSGAERYFLRFKVIGLTETIGPVSSTKRLVATTLYYCLIGTSKSRNKTMAGDN
jgi:hypothetical protein